MPGSRAIARKEDSRIKAIRNIVEDMQMPDHIVIVEGMHDVRVVERFKIAAITFERFRSDGSELNNYSKVMIFTDIDDSGKREAKQIAHLLEDKGIRSMVDETSGPRLLRLIGGVRCVEELGKPLENILEDGHSIHPILATIHHRT